MQHISSLQIAPDILYWTQGSSVGKSGSIMHYGSKYRLLYQVSFMTEFVIIKAYGQLKGFYTKREKNLEKN